MIFDNHNSIEEIEHRYHFDSLSITNCKRFKRYSNTHTDSHVGRLTIAHCDNFTDFNFKGGNLDTLEIINCDALQDILCGGEDVRMYNLKVIDCFGLENIWYGEHKIQSIFIDNCPSLLGVVIVNDGLSGLCEDVTITNTPDLEVLALEGQGISEINLLEFPKLKNLNMGKWPSTGNNLKEINTKNNTLLRNLYIDLNNLNRLDLSNNKLVSNLSVIGNPLPIVYIPEPFSASAQKEPYTQLAVLRDTLSNPTITASQTGAYELGITGAIANIVTNNGGEGSLLAAVNSGLSVVAPLPSGIEYIRGDRYWRIEESGLSDYKYNLILDLSTMDSLDIDSCEVLFRPDSLSPFVKVTDLSDTVETVAHFKIINGLTQFGGFAVSGIGGIVSVQKEKEIIQENFSLEQNYPNPFNPSTNINYSIPKQTHVSLKVFDVLGREITTLVNKEQPTGNYEVEFDASNLTSGIYFFRIQTGEFVETKKMILMK